MAPPDKIEPLDLWYLEKFSENWGLSLRIKGSIYSAFSGLQRIDVLEAEEFGRLLLLDSAIMLTEKDEFTYHEMLVHVPLFTHLSPQKVLVIGGGDGSTLQEVTRHPQVEEVTHVEIDEEVIRVSKKFFPQLSSGFDDPRVSLKVTNGIRFVKECPPESYDIVLVDSTDPKGPAEGLFTAQFYSDCHKVLKEDGILTVQAGSPYFQQDLLAQVHRAFKELFPIVWVYLSGVVTYGGMWAFALGSKKHDPIRGPSRESKDIPLKYYTSQIHKGAFILPKYIEELLGL